MCALNYLVSFALSAFRSDDNETAEPYREDGMVIFLQAKRAGTL